MSFEKINIICDGYEVYSVFELEKWSCTIYNQTINSTYVLVHRSLINLDVLPPNYKQFY